MSLDLVFSKMSGLGNDFIAIDNRDGQIQDLQYPALAQRLCPRRTSVGADGILILENAKDADFRMRYLNPDGTEAMCGNGARCIVRFAHALGAIGNETVFQADDGNHNAWVQEKEIRLEMKPPKDVRLNIALDLGELGQWMFHQINTGVPHVVAFHQDIENLDVHNVGRTVRYHEEFAPSGTNVNFAFLEGQQVIRIRTYERGVEEETLACGTGATATALLAASLGRAQSPVTVRTKSGGILTIDFSENASEIKEVFLTGDAVEVFRGSISI